MVRDWLRPFTRIHTIPVSRKLLVYLVLMGLYTALVDWFSSGDSKTFVQANGGLFGSLILSVLIVFRTNSANDRWWEARKLWGQLVNDSRNFIIKLSCFPGIEESSREQLSRLLIAFPFALKQHLRGDTNLCHVPGFEQDQHKPNHLPLYIAEQTYVFLSLLKTKKQIDGFEQLQLDRHARALMDICGACERIKSSPIALSYRAIMRQLIALNLLGLPWYLAPDFHLWTVPIALVAAYFLIGLELIAEDIEEPFGVGDDNLPLEKYCETIKCSINDVLSAEHDPEAIVNELARAVQGQSPTGSAVSQSTP